MNVYCGEPRPHSHDFTIYGTNVGQTAKMAQYSLEELLVSSNSSLKETKVLKESLNKNLFWE